MEYSLEPNERDGSSMEALLRLFSAREDKGNPEFICPFCLHIYISALYGNAMFTSVSCRHTFSLLLRLDGGSTQGKAVFFFGPGGAAALCSSLLRVYARPGVDSQSLQTHLESIVVN